MDCNFILHEFLAIQLKYLNHVLTSSIIPLKGDMAKMEAFKGDSHLEDITGSMGIHIAGAINSQKRASLRHMFGSLAVSTRSI